MAITKISNNSLSAISTLPASIPTGALTLLSTQTASSSASIEFTSGIDSTYDSYVFKCIDIHPQTDNVDFTFNFSSDGGSNYNVTKTTTAFDTYHFENDSATALEYLTLQDLAQSTSNQILIDAIGNGSDENNIGIINLYNPSSETFVKHFTAIGNRYYYGDATAQHFVAGYCNTTSAVDAIKFQMSSGNFDGIIKMYGVS